MDSLSQHSSLGSRSAWDDPAWPPDTSSRVSRTWSSQTEVVGIHKRCYLHVCRSPSLHEESPICSNQLKQHLDTDDPKMKGTSPSQEKLLSVASKRKTPKDGEDLHAVQQRWKRITDARRSQTRWPAHGDRPINFNEALLLLPKFVLHWETLCYICLFFLF